jgi:hypothetical protein
MLARGLKGGKIVRSAQSVVGYVGVHVVTTSAKVESPTVRRHSGSASLVRELIIRFIVLLFEMQKRRPPISGKLQSTFAIPHDIQFLCVHDSFTKY